MEIGGRWPLCELVSLVEFAECRGRPIAFIGIGTENLREADALRMLSDSLVPKVAFWSVRSPRDRDRLVGYGVSEDRVTVAADLSWLIEPASLAFGKDRLTNLGVKEAHPIIGVNVTNESWLENRAPLLLDGIAKLLDLLIARHGAQVVFLTNEIRHHTTMDRQASRRVLACMKKGAEALLLPNEYLPPQKMLSVLSCCHLTIGMRLHFCSFSAQQAIPFIAIKRQEKLEDFCWDISWKYSTCPENFDVEAVAEMVQEIGSRRNALSEVLKQSREKMRKRAFLNRIAMEKTMQLGAMEY